MRAKKSNRELLSHAVFPPMGTAAKCEQCTAPCKDCPRGERRGERPNQMSFGEQVVEALGEYIDAKNEYADTRRSSVGEFANPDHVDKAATRLQGLLDKVRFSL